MKYYTMARDYMQRLSTSNWELAAPMPTLLQMDAHFDLILLNTDNDNYILESWH